jgi:hypothetical protein
MRRRPDNTDQCPARFTRIELLVVIAIIAMFRGSQRRRPRSFRHPTSFREGDTVMLAPILIDLLIGCSLMLLAGWAGEALRAGARCGQRNLRFKKQADWTRM